MKEFLKSILVAACFFVIFACSEGEKYTLTIHGAEGSGTYPQGEEVSLAIKNLPVEKVFLRWGGGGGYVKDVYSAETSVLIPDSDITIKAEFRDKESCGITDLDQIRKDVQSSVTHESNARSRHAALNRWWRLLWRQGYDMSAFDATAKILLSTRESTPEVIQAIDQGFSILEELFANPEYIGEVAGAAAEGQSRDQSANRKAGTNWPFYHGIDGAQTGYSPDPGPSEGKVAWRYPKPYRSTAQPILSEGRIYLSSPGIDVVGYCLDEESGEVLWNARQFGTDFYGTPKVRVSPVLSGDRIVFRAGLRTANMHVLNKATGERIPADKTDMEPSPSGESIIGGYYGNWFTLYDAVTGETRFLQTATPVAGEPLLAEGMIYVVCEEGKVEAHQAESGEIIWQQELEKELAGNPVLSSGRIYAGSRDGTLFALDSSDGKVLWSYEADEKSGQAFRYYSTPVESGNRLYIGGAGSTLYCMDAVTGELIWKHSVSDWVRSQPMVIGELVYVATMDGNIYALRDKGSEAEEVMKRKVNEHGFAANLAGGEKGILATGRDLILYSISPETFFLNWKHGILDGTWVDGEFYRADWTGGLQPSPTIVDGILYCGGMDGFVHALDAETGKEIWRFESGGTTGAAITVAGNKVFFGIIHGKGDYYALDKNSGELIWKTSDYGNVWVGASCLFYFLFN